MYWHLLDLLIHDPHNALTVGKSNPATNSSLSLIILEFASNKPPSTPSTMITASAAILTFAAFTTLATSGVDGHGTLLKPALTFTGTGYGGNFQSDIPMNSLTPQSGDKFTNYPDYSMNAAAVSKALKASQYKSLRHFMYATQDMSHGRFNMPKTAECGFTDPVSGAVQALPDEVEWYGGQMIHDGPCEIWCDEVVVLPFTENCRVTYSDGKFPYDKAKCQDKSRLTMYWLSTLMEWQVYIDCAKIGAGGVAASNDTAAIAAKAKNAPSSFDSPSSAGTVKPAW